MNPVEPNMRQLPQIQPSKSKIIKFMLFRKKNGLLYKLLKLQPGGPHLENKMATSQVEEDNDEEKEEEEEEATRRQRAGRRIQLTFLCFT